jgi:uncharacterized membrane protein YdjX (TVP38/TMEM64 family)
VLKNTSYKKLISILIWALMAYFLYKNKVMTLDKASIISYINQNSNYTKLLFVFLASARVFIFIPGVVFMIIGGVLFGAFTGFFLSMISMIISQTIVYFLSQVFELGKLRKKLLNKHPYFDFLMKEYDYKFLSLGIITPIAPTDVICFLSGLSGIKYKRFILTVIASNIPMMLVYSSMGDSFGNSVFSSLLLVFSIILCCTVTVQTWIKLKVLP